METTTLKSPPEEPEPDSPNPIQPAKPLSFSNGVLKLRTPHAPHAPPHAPHAPYSPNTYNEHIKHHAPPHAPGTYMECLKNHAAAIGGNAVDGCGEFMPSATSLCAACGCHRNFHRLYPRAAASTHAPPSHHLPLLEYRPHRRHRPSPPRLSPSPPPISSSHMLLSLSSPNINNTNPNNGGGVNNNSNNNSKKRFRTRFTPIQKEKMYELAERLTWKMQRRDEEMISGFCEKIGVEKGVFKVWMHNNKNSRGKKETVSANGVFISKGNGINLDDYRDRDNNSNSTDEVSGHHVGTNGSSSCS